MTHAGGASNVLSLRAKTSENAAAVKRGCQTRNRMRLDTWSCEKTL
jgi:hypothetical protein